MCNVLVFIEVNIAAQFALDTKDISIFIHKMHKQREQYNLQSVMLSTSYIWEILLLSE